MKVSTIEQFKILKFVEENFRIEKIEIELYGEKCIRIVDTKGEVGFFKYQDGKVVLSSF